MRRIVVMAAPLALLGASMAFAQSSDTTSGIVADSSTAPRTTVRIEALAWWFSASPVTVPLVTDGIFGQPGTNVLLGNEKLDTNANIGFKLSGDYALGPSNGIEASFFYFGSRSTTRGVSSSGTLDSTDLKLPFFDAISGVENATDLSFSPVYRGEAQEELSNSLAGFELNGRWALVAESSRSIDLIAGFRYMRLREKFTFTTSSPNLPPNPTDVWNTSDAFDATNNFYGAQIGVRGRNEWGPWFAQGTAKVAIGTMMQSVNVNGSFVTNDFNGFAAPQTFAGGYFALPSNAGDHDRSVFAVVPEIALTAGYQFNKSASVFVGYSFLYASNVVRPGNQINRNVNTTQSLAYGGEPPVNPQGPAQPSFGFNNSDFWAQGISIGLAFRF